MVKRFQQAFQRRYKIANKKKKKKIPVSSVNQRDANQNHKTWLHTHWNITNSYQRRVDRIWSDWRSDSAVEMQNGTTTILENTSAMSYEVKHILNIRPSNSTARYS